MCGFNKKMLEGMEAFHEGLLESVIDDKEKIEILEEDN